MGQYNGDQIANNPTVVANYLKAAPTTRLATRQIQFLKVHSASTNWAIEPDAPNSNFSKAVRGVQAQAEVVIIGSPSDGAFIIGVYADTMNDGNISDPAEYFSNGFARTIGQSVNASVGITDVDVDLVVIYGNTFVGWQRAINYVNPQSIQIDGSYSYQGQSSYENELYTD